MHASKNMVLKEGLPHFNNMVMLDTLIIKVMKSTLMKQEIFSL